MPFQTRFAHSRSRSRSSYWCVPCIIATLTPDISLSHRTNSSLSLTRAHIRTLTWAFQQERATSTPANKQTLLHTRVHASLFLEHMFFFSPTCQTPTSYENKPASHTHSVFRPLTTTVGAAPRSFSFVSGVIKLVCYRLFHCYCSSFCLAYSPTALASSLGCFPKHTHIHESVIPTHSDRS